MGKYKIEKKTSGYLIKFNGDLDFQTAEKWYAESRKILVTDERESFGVIIDWRDFGVIKPEAEKLMKEAQQYWRDHGMNRIAVITNDPVKKLNLARIAKKSGIYDKERYIDINENKNWKVAAKEWVVNGVEPS